MKKKIKHQLEPIYDQNSEVLLLGSIPSVKSREENFYYAHPYNRFWRVLSTIYHSPLPQSNEEKTLFLLEHHIALWDVISSCYIEGSSDASISNVKVNNINKLLKNTNIKAIFTTGKTAQKYYDRYCFEKTGVKAVCLPSTSPANASYSFEALVESYQQILTK